VVMGSVRASRAECQQRVLRWPLAEGVQETTVGGYFNFAEGNYHERGRSGAFPPP
jgi:hypothetical protein